MSLSLFMTRWLLTPLAMPTAVVAGLSGHRPAAYAASVAAGELVWTLLYIGLGYFFGASWPAVLAWVGDGAGLVAGLGVAAVAVALLIRVNRAASSR
jgi:membrane-associated protein